MNSPLFELALVLVRFDHIARFIVTANHRIHESVFFDPFGKTIGHKIQSDVMFKECFQAREHQRKPLSRIGRLFYKCGAVASEASVRDADERCAILRRFISVGGETGHTVYRRPTGPWKKKSFF